MLITFPLLFVKKTPSVRKAKVVRKASHSTTDDDFLEQPTSPIVKTSAKKRLSLTKANEIRTPTSTLLKTSARKRLSLTKEN